MKKIWIKLLAVATFAPAVYILHILSGGYPLALLLSVMLLLFAARGFEKYRLPEEETFFSWIKKEIR